MLLRFFLAGKEVSRAKHNEIICSKLDVGIRNNRVVLSDHIKVIKDKIDQSDPLLLEAMRILNIPIEKTYIIFGTYGPLENAITYVHGYW